MKVSFVHASGSVQFSKNPSLPGETDLHLLQPVEKSTGGDPFGFDSLDRDKDRTLYWPRMPKIDLDNLLYYFQIIVGGMSKPWAYHAIEGDVWQVRFATPQIEYEEVGFETYAVKVILRED